MMIEIKFKGPISKQVDNNSVLIEIESDSSLAGLLTKVIENQSYLQSIWREPSEIDRDSMILCNGVDIGVLGGLEMTMNEGDVLTILPLVHGG
jgi:molybdopterin converting factor small subunit